MENLTLEERVARALEMHDQTFNCAQCVALAVEDMVEVDRETLFKIMEGFGAGMGGNTQTCGALSAVVALVGLANSSGSNPYTSKKSTYAHVEELVDDFHLEHGSTICEQLLDPNLQTRKQTCNKYIATSVELACEAVGRISAGGAAQA